MNAFVRSLLDALYLTIALATSVVAMAVWIAGVSVATAPLAIPLALLTALLLRGMASAHAALARALLA